MRVTVGTQLLGDSYDEAAIGGFSCSGSALIQEAQGLCAGWARIKDKGQKSFQATVPTVREFSSVAKAQKWMLEAASEGSFKGYLKFKFAGFGEVTVPYGIAQPSNLTHKGVSVFATWDIVGGEEIT